MTRRTFFVLMCFMSIIAFTSTAHAQSSKKTITLPNGEVVWDLNGEWDVLIENYGRLSRGGSYPQLVKATQTGGSFVAIRMRDDPFHKKGSEQIRGELDKDGFKKIQIMSAYGPLDAKSEISNDGNKMTFDSADMSKLTYIRK